MAVEVRPAVADDVAAIEEVGRRTWPATCSFAGDDYIAYGLATWWPSKVLQSLEDTTVTALVNRVPAGTRSVQLEYLDGSERAAACYAARGSAELRRVPAERRLWPDTVWVERLMAAEATAGR